MTTSSFIFSTALFLALLVAFPAWDVLEVRRLRAATNIKAREFYYWRILGVEWTVTLFVILLLGWHATIFFNVIARPSWMPPQSTLLVLLAAFVVGLAVPIVVAARRTPGATFITKQLASIDYLLPKTPAQRWLFLLVSLTAGICEEVIFRAFALHYLTALLPGTSIWVCVVLAAILFGLIHMGQGVAGVLSTGFLGAIFSILYIGFGSLWAPILLHILLDARFALLPLSKKDAVTAS